MTDTEQSYIVDLIKSRPPQGADELVERQCLSRMLAEEQSTRNILVLAPVGYGKTSLLVQFFERLRADNKDVAWLSVSEHDTDATHFLSGITASIQMLDGNLGNLTQSLLGSGLQISQRVILTSLLNEILQSERSITLFLDDLHRADSSEFSEVIAELLENGPRNFKLVLASRTSMPVFSRMRARSKLVEFGCEYLRVNYNEAEQLLTKICPEKLSRTNIFDLLERVDGWISGVQIAALSINASTDVNEYIRSFSGSGKNFAEYIEHDIYAKLPAEMQQFLVETSILEVLTPELCSVVTGHHEGERLLLEIQQANLFLITVDEEQSCYRYHHFFREFLRSKLTEISGSGQITVHRRAYRWCLDHGLVSEAIDHMEAAGDWEISSDTIADQLEDVLSKNRLSTLKRWVGQLPEALAESSPVLLLSRGWIAALERDVSVAYHYIERAMSLNLELPSRVQSNIAALKAVTVIVEDDPEKITELAQTDTVAVPEEHGFFRVAYVSSLIYALMYEGKYDQGHRLATELEVIDTDVNFHSVVYSHVFRGLGYRLAGQLEKATEQYGKAQSIAQKKLGDGWLPFCVHSPMLAEVYYEWGRFSEASILLENQEYLRRGSAVIEPLICAYQVASRLADREGDREKALQVLAEGEAVGRKDKYVRLVVAMLSERIRQLLAANRPEPAAAAYRDLNVLRDQQKSVGKWSEVNYFITLGVCRYLIGTEKSKEALAMLSEQSALARKKSQNRCLLKLLLLEARALEMLGKQRAAANRVVEAITLGAHGNFQQTFIEADPPVVEHIRTVLESWSDAERSNGVAVDPAYIETLRAIFGVEPNSEQLIDYSVNLEGLDPLTPREMTLLKYLRRGLKNKELAHEMHLSVHTVAWHLKNLYSKLGVDNRTAAVNVAQQLKLD